MGREYFTVRLTAHVSNAMAVALLGEKSSALSLIPPGTIIALGNPNIK